MSHAPNYTPTASFSADESTQAAGRSTVKTISLDTELANISASINAVNSNLKLLQRDDGKVKDMIVEPYMLSEQARALVSVGGIPRGDWVATTAYAVKDVVQYNGFAYICHTAHTSASAFDNALWMGISGDGSAAASAAAAAASELAAALSAASIDASAALAQSQAAAAAASAVDSATSATSSANSAAGAAASKAATDLNVTASAGSAASALNSKNAAGVSETNSAANATASNTARVAAESAAATATTKATEAGASAAAAAGSATSASGSASASATSATEAAASAVTALETVTGWLGQEAYLTDMVGQAIKELYRYEGVTDPRLAAIEPGMDVIVQTMVDFADLLGVTARAVSGGDIMVRLGTVDNPSISIFGNRNTGFYSPAANQLAVTINGVQRLLIDATGNHLTGTDNAQTLGSAAKRWSTVYAGTGTINTSDAREKTAVASLTADEIAAAKDLSKEVGTYQFLESIAAKGDAARHHVGLTVQRAIEIMRLHNLDPMRYGFICYDVWPEVSIEHPAVAAVPEVLDADGNILEMGTQAQDAWTEVIQTAGDRYSFRYDQLNLFMAAGLNARLAALEPI